MRCNPVKVMCNASENCLKIDVSRLYIIGKLFKKY